MMLERFGRTVAGSLCSCLCFVAIAHAGAPDAGGRPDETAAERGYRLLTTKAYLPADFSQETFDALWQAWPEPLRSQAEQASPEERRKMAYSRYGLVEAPGRDGDPALGYVSDGQGNWVLNCLSCHGGKVAGRAMPGLGNSHFAFQTLVQDTVKLKRVLNQPLTDGDVGKIGFPMGRTNGVTNAQVFSIALVSMRDDELNFVGSPSRLPELVHHDLDAPPLWNTKRKKRLYIDGFVEKTPRTIMQFVFTPVNDAATLKSWEGDFADMLAWIESLEAPQWPWSIDQSLAERGRAVFNQYCADCHGTYGEGGSYPEKMVDIDEVGTDPLRLTGMPSSHRSFFSRGWMGEYGKRTTIDNPPGYVAPPLDGVWASAPYFHNGSVPTLWHVLHPSERPAVWRRSEDGYDQEKVGLEVTTHDTVDRKLEISERRQYFDASIPGKSAAGHTFPDALSEDEKRAVLEYLKTL